MPRYESGSDVKQGKSSGPNFPNELLKQDTLSTITFGQDSDYLNSPSNLNILNTAEDELARTDIDWAQMGDSEIAMNSHSYSTMVHDNNDYSHFPSGSPFRREMDVKYEEGISPHQLEGHYEISANDVNLFNFPHGHDHYEHHPDYTYYYPPVENFVEPSLRPAPLLAAINALGTSTFSTSFVEKVVSQAANNDMIPGEYPPMVPHHYDHPAYHSTSNPEWDKSNHLPQIHHHHQAKKRSSESQQTQPNRRRTSQFPIQCTDCKQELGIIFIRGSFSDFEHPQVTCTGCQQTNEEFQAGERKRKRKESQLIQCEVCRASLGHGGCNQGGEVKTEYVCHDCGNRFMFCSECGGGGKQRTGKWRPKELFENGRRTCSLPHIRVGTAEVHYKVIKAEDLTSEILNGIQEVFFDCLLSLYCVPSLMANSKLNSFEAVKQEIEQLWLSSVLDVLTNKVLSGPKYITVAWIQKRHRNKGAAKPNQNKEIVPWLQRLNLTGIVNPLKPGEVEDDQCFVAFSIAEWDIENRSVFLAQMAPRSVFLKTMEGYMDLIRNCVEAIYEDTINLNEEKPVHIWCWAKNDNSRLQSIPSRLKFVPLGDYLRLHPKVKESIFYKSDYEPLQSESSLTFATYVKAFLK